MTFAATGEHPWPFCVYASTGPEEHTSFCEILHAPWPTNLNIPGQIPPLFTGHGHLFRRPFFLSNPMKRRWMMLIIEIHAETIEESNPSTHPKWEDERSKQAKENSQTTGNRFWKAFKRRVPGYLIQYHKDEK
jgi:hypothetical protein